MKLSAGSDVSIAASPVQSTSEFVGYSTRDEGDFGVGSELDVFFLIVAVVVGVAVGVVAAVVVVVVSSVVDAAAVIVGIVVVVVGVAFTINIGVVKRENGEEVWLLFFVFVRRDVGVGYFFEGLSVVAIILVHI